MTNRQTETKPFRSLADMYRDKGLCVCGCGLPFRYEVTAERIASMPHFAGLLGEWYSTGHNYNGAPAFNRERALKNRSTPAPETGGAKPFDFGPFTPEDWDWLLGEARQQDPEAVVFAVDYLGPALCAATPDGRGYSFERRTVLARLLHNTRQGDGMQLNLTKERALREARAQRRVYPDDCPEATARWSGKSPAGVGSVDASTRKGEEYGKNGGSGRADRPSGTSRVAGPDNIPEPTLAEATRHCAECGAVANMAGCAFVGIETPLCDGCRGRRCELLDSLVPEPARQPCGDGCRCVYCRYSKGEGNLERAEIDRSYRYDTDNPKVGQKRLALESARQRLALMDKRERPRPTADSRELARKHPWECPDD